MYWRNQEPAPHYSRTWSPHSLSVEIHLGLGGLQNPTVARHPYILEEGKAGGWKLHPPWRSPQERCPHFGLRSPYLWCCPSFPLHANLTPIALRHCSRFTASPWLMQNTPSFFFPNCLCTSHQWHPLGLFGSGGWASHPLKTLILLPWTEGKTFKGFACLSLPPSVAPRDKYMQADWKAWETS